MAKKPTYDELVQRVLELEKIALELKKAKNALQESEEKFRILTVSSPVGMFLDDAQGNAIYINGKCAELIGMPAEEALNLDWVPSIHPDDRERVTAEWSRAFQTGGEFHQEYRWVHTDGRIVWTLGDIVPVRGSDGEVIVYIGTLTDITERKQAEAERERLTQAMDQSGEAIIITGTEGGIQYVNPAFTRITGYRREEVIGRNPRLLKSGKHDSKFYKRMWNTLTRGDTWSGRITNKRKDGTLYTEKAVISPVRDASGRTVNYVAVKRDITKEMKLEQQLYLAQKMESVGRLAGGVAHDFNNALSVIIGFTELAMDEVGPTGPLHANLEEVLKAAKRAADTTRQLLAFARKQTIAPKVLDLNENVESMLKMLRRLIGEDIDLAWLPGKGLWPVKMDPSQIDQILANLCVNARDAIESVGKITIETGNTPFDKAYCAHHHGFKPGEFVMLAVSDNGCGIKKEMLDIIFEPFFTTKDIDKGTGLGLATVYGIVKQNNGFINVYSEPGKGTSIKIYLPRHEGQAVETQQENMAPIPAGRGETILLVEDDLSILRLARSILEGLDYTVLAAGTPGEAISLAENHRGDIHLLVTDVIMPEMNGRELLQRLQSLYPGIRYMFMSGYTANVIAHHGVLEEGVHFIQKPLSKRDLAKTVRKALDE